MWLVLLLACARTVPPQAPLPDGWLERAPANTADARVVVFLHGRGDKPDSMLRLLDDLPDDVHLIAPRAPYPLGTGWSWFHGRAAGGDTPALGDEVAAQADQVAALLDGLNARRAASDKAVIGGFSQGAMLSFAVAARHPSAISAAVPVAGFLPQTLVPDAAPAGAAPIYALHGDADEIIALTLAVASVDALNQAGFNASLERYPGVGHTIPAPMRDELLRRLRD